MSQETDLSESIKNGAGFAVGTGIVAFLALLLFRNLRENDATATPTADELLTAARGC